MQPTTTMNVSIAVPDSQVANALISALESSCGSRYWASIEGHKRPPKLVYRTDKKHIYEHIDYPMNEGGYVAIRDAEAQAEGKRSLHRLTRTKLRRGLVVMATKYPRHFAALLGENGDAITGDVMLQCALFGDVIYE